MVYYFIANDSYTIPMFYILLNKPVYVFYLSDLGKKITRKLIILNTEQKNIAIFFDNLGLLLQSAQTFIISIL